MNSFYLFTDGILFLPNISRLHISRLPYLSIHKYLTTMVTMAATSHRHRTLAVTGMSLIFTTNLDNCSLLSVYPSLGNTGHSTHSGPDWGLVIKIARAGFRWSPTQTWGRGPRSCSTQCLLVLTRWCLRSRDERQ